MADILMIADDMTGALDSGVMFRRNAIDTEVLINRAADFTSLLSLHTAVVVNAETRHLPPQQAYEAVYELASRAWELGIPYLYKKTDSALRGNIGAELEAVLRASGQSTIHFAPAFPQQHRTTVGGIQYIDGIPLHQSPFAQDPLNPMTSACIPHIIAETSQVPVCKGGELPSRTPCIQLYDAETEKDLEEIARRALFQEDGRVFAGCAGFIGELSKWMHMGKTPVDSPCVSGPLMVFCGSLHEQSRRQFELAERAGIRRFSLDARMLSDPAFWKSDSCGRLVETLRNLLAENSSFLFCPIGEAGEMYPGERACISQRLPDAIARLICSVLDGNGSGIPMIIGGDTLGAFLRFTGTTRVRPIREVRTGVVLAEAVDGRFHIPFIAKAGSFGEDTLLLDLFTANGAGKPSDKRITALS